MKNLKIGTKLLITFMIIIILFCTTVYMATSGMRKSSKLYTSFFNTEYKLTNSVMSMRRSLQIVVKDLAFITIDKDESRYEEYMEDMQKELGFLEENAVSLSSYLADNSEDFQRFSDSLYKAYSLQQEVIEIADTDMEKAQKMLVEEYQPLVKESVDALIQISEDVDAAAESNYQETIKLQSSLTKSMLGLAAAALFITIVLCLYLTGMITKPIRELEASAGKIVAGNFNFDISYKSKDELGRLADAFRDMESILGDIIADASRLLEEMSNGNFDVRTKAEERYVGDFQGLLSSIRKLNRDLSSTLAQINSSADQVSSGSNQVSYGAQALSQGATEQAASVEELAATISGISQQVKETAENAAEARNQSSSAGDKVEECNRQMKDMTKAMEEITRTSNEIGKIIKTIEDIAFQTNILALNAAVEASRAGTAGKGFAVVADEVRNLASKSAEASKDTSDLIESVMGAVTQGTKITNATAKSLIQVVDQVRAACGTVEKIASAAEVQAGAVDQVSVGVDQISSVVQTNSSTAVESAAASEELSSQAEMLKNLVAKFILREEYIRSVADIDQSYHENTVPAQIELDDLDSDFGKY